MESYTTTTTSATVPKNSNNNHHDAEKQTLRILMVIALIFGGVAVPAFLFLYSDRGPYENTYPLFIPPGMGVIIILCVLGLIIPVALGKWARRRNSRKFNTKSKSKDAENKDDSNNRITKMQWFRRNLSDGLYIEFHKRPSIPELMEEARINLAALPPPAHHRDRHMKKESEDEADYDEEADEDGHEEVNDRYPHNNRPIGPGCLAKENEIRSYYKSADDNDDNTDDKVVFVLRLALGLLATGHCTVDVETTVLKAAAALRLRTPRLSVGHRLLQAQFGSTPPHFLTCKRDFVFSTLKDLQLLADAVIAGEEIQPNEAHVAVEALNNILDTPLPYGWIM